MEKLNELVEQAKFVADWYGSDWSSALCQGKDGKQAHEIICESRGEAVISTGSNSNEASWLCDYLELCSPANILAIVEAFRALEQQRDALAAENAVMLILLTDISEQYQEVQTESEENAAVIDLDYISEVNAYVSRDVDGENPLLATDAYLNSVRAEGAIALRDALVITDDGADIYAVATEVAAQLRASKDGE